MLLYIKVKNYYEIFFHKTIFLNSNPAKSQVLYEILRNFMKFYEMFYASLR